MQMATRRKLFTGSYIDGLSIDLLDWAGIELSDQQIDSIWAEHNEMSLLELCPSAEIEIEREIDDQAPGLNDTYFSVYSEDADELRQQLRQLIDGLIGSK
jgi:hypothetical protein